MLIGYARTSTIDQQAGIEAQLRDLKATGCERIWQEQVSSVAARPELAAALDFAREGDTFLVTKLDRLARSIADLWVIVDKLQAKGVTLRILSMGLDTSNATGKLTLSVLGAIAQFEREMMLERQREGIAKAKAEGKYAKSGRPPIPPEQASKIRELAELGVPKSSIARRLSVSRASVHRILAVPAG